MPVRRTSSPIERSPESVLSADRMTLAFLRSRLRLSEDWIREVEELRSGHCPGWEQSSIEQRAFWAGQVLEIFNQEHLCESVPDDLVAWLQAAADPPGQAALHADQPPTDRTCNYCGRIILAQRDEHGRLCCERCWPSRFALAKRMDDFADPFGAANRRLSIVIKKAKP